MSRHIHFSLSRAGMLLLLASAGSLTCTDFDRFDTGVCGNRILEPLKGEDCDGDASQYGTGYLCGDRTTPEACRLLCQEGELCPAGWACGLDGICRQASGGFAVTATLATPAIANMLAADLDADRRGDLVVSTDDNGDGRTNNLGVHYLGDDGTIDDSSAAATRLKSHTPLVAGSVGVAADSSDPTVALMVALSVSVTALPLRGRSDRTLLPALGAEWGSVGDDARLAPSMSIFQDAGVVPLFDGDRSSFLQGGYVFGPSPGYGVAGPVMLRADFEVDDEPIFAKTMVSGTWITGIGVEQIAVAVAGTDKVRVYLWQLSNDQRLWPIWNELTLPEGVLVDPDGGVWAGDIGGEGNADVFVAGDDGNTYVCYGEGYGGFYDVPFDPFDPNGPPPDFDPQLSGNRFQKEPLIIGAHPLAAGDIDGDGIVDFVFDGYGVAMSDADPINLGYRTCPQFTSNTFHSCGVHDSGALIEPDWAEAVLTNINGDGLVDVLAAPKASSELHVLLGIGRERLRVHVLPTASPPRMLSPGEFDGDRIGDVAFRTAGEQHGVAVSFGQVGGGPEPAVEIFAAAQIDAMQTMPSQRDLAVLTRNSRDERQLSMAFGSTSEGLLAPLIVPCPVEIDDEEAQKKLVPQQFGVGRFDDNAGGDVALLYRDCYPIFNAPPPDRLVLLPGAEHATIGPLLHEPLPATCARNLLGCNEASEALKPRGVELPTTAAWSQDGVLVALDLDPADGLERDDVVLFAPDGAGSQIAVLHFRTDDSEGPRFVLDPVVDSNLPIGGPYTSWRGSAEAADVDADGLLDIVALTTEEVPRVVLFRNVGGKLDFEAPVVIGVPDGEVLQGFALIDADYDGKRDEAYVSTDSSVFRASLDLEAASMELSIVSAEYGGSRLVASDMTGDGLVDVAVASADQVVVLKAQAINP